MPTRCCIGLGGNLNGVEAAFQQAVDRLQHSGFSVLAVSSVHRTPPMGASAGGEFLNAAAMLSTSLSAKDTLAALHHTEAAAGRTRHRRWEPRPLDLDLLLFGDDVCDSGDLVVPHPALWYRRFVLDPMSEIAADVIHPVFRLSIAELRNRLLRRPLIFEIEAPNNDPRTLARIGETNVPDGVRLRASRTSGACDSDVFAKLRFVNTPADGATPRTQPRHPQDFVIELPLQDWQQGLHDVLTAALG
ncbi:MAG: 2-amino-4-hydroxy-6-hydroxymethyldihydropteridine diphosphokinase [Planctomycetaceae bacterium]